jgi:hypothetical protein
MDISISCYLLRGLYTEEKRLFMITSLKLRVRKFIADVDRQIVKESLISNIWIQNLITRCLKRHSRKISAVTQLPIKTLFYTVLIMISMVGFM